jgi:pimeloyl-ACP methyl ester carboxylesterase
VIIIIFILKTRILQNIEKKSLVIKNRHGDNLTTDFRYPSGGKDLPVVIFVHGFKGFKDWGGFPYIFERIASEGFFVVSFNFSYNGVGENENEQMEFTRLELFAQNTFSRELDDLGSVIDFLFENKDIYGYSTESVALIGHSRGGGIAILKAGEDKRVTKLIALASVSGFNRYSEAQKEKWKNKGYFEVMNARTKQVMRLNYTLYEDLEKNADRLNIEKAMERIDIPALIIHGTVDLSVDYSNSENLYAHSNKSKTKLVILEKTGHTFGVAHPYAGTTKALEEVLTLTIDFLKEE